MPRQNAPISLSNAVKRVKAKASEWYDESTNVDAPKSWGRTYVEPDDDVYITADMEQALISKWEGDSTDFGILNQKGSGSSSGSQVDLKLQLSEDWGDWKKGKSPFVYHIPIDTYLSPEMIRQEQERKEQIRLAKEKREQEALAEKQRIQDEKDRQIEVKRLQKVEKQKQQALATAKNEHFGKTKPKKGEEEAFEKAWLKKFGGRYM